MFRNILIPTDGSEMSQQAVRAGVDFAREIDAEVTFFTALPPYKVFASEPMMLSDTPDRYEMDARRIAEARLRDATAYAEEKGVVAHAESAFEEFPYKGILDTAARNHCDLIVMASHGRGGVKSLLLGSETNKILAHASIPVQVLRAPAPA